MIQNPIASTEANRNGIDYVIKRMDWYWYLSSIISKESPNESDGGLGSIRRELEIQVVDLYKALLLYEIKSVCFYYRSRGLVLLRDIAKLSDWNGDIRAVENAERIFNDAANTLMNLKKASNLEQLVNYAEMQSKTQMTREDQQCMKDLRLTDPSADKKRIEQTKGGLLHDANSWILNNSDYQQWRNNEESRVLWIKGDPGRGKSMLLCGIIDELDQHSASSGIAHIITGDNISIADPDTLNPTDSGYATIPTRDNEFDKPANHDNRNTTQSSQELDGQDISDAKTVYSEESSTANSSRQAYIWELAENLFRNLHSISTNRDFPANVSTSLPDLLQAFALMVGHNAPTQMHRDIMAFVHKYRQ